MENQTTPAPATGATDKKQHSGQAIAAFILGVVSIIGWLLPIIGIPVTIVGLILGIIGRRSSYRGLAIAGIVLNAIFLVLSLGNGIAGACLAV